FLDGGLGRVEDCQLFELTYPAFRIDNESDPLVQRCHIHHFEGNGIYVDEKGKGRFEDCKFEHFGEYPAVLIEQESTTILQRCTIHQGKSPGIVVAENGYGTIKQCNLSGFHTSPAIVIQEKSNPLIKNCKVYDGGGIYIFDEGHGVIENSQLFQMNMPAI